MCRKDSCPALSQGMNCIFTWIGAGSIAEAPAHFCIQNDSQEYGVNGLPELIKGEDGAGGRLAPNMHACVGERKDINEILEELQMPNQVTLFRRVVVVVVGKK